MARFDGADSLAATIFYMFSTILCRAPSIEDEDLSIYTSKQYDAARKLFSCIAWPLQQAPPLGPGEVLVLPGP